MASSSAAGGASHIRPAPISLLLEGKAGKAPSGSPAALSRHTSAADSPKTATTPQAEACGVASACPRLIASEAGLAPSGSPAAPSHHPDITDALQTATTPQAEACGVASL